VGEWCELTSLREQFIVEPRDELHFHRQIEEFVSAIEEGRDPSPSGRTGRKTLEVALAIYASAEQGAPVDLPIAEGP
jgi:predicted dehydrogenase